MTIRPLEPPHLEYDVPDSQDSSMSPHLEHNTPDSRQSARSPHLEPNAPDSRESSRSPPRKSLPSKPPLSEIINLDSDNISESQDAQSPVSSTPETPTPDTPTAGFTSDTPVVRPTAEKEEGQGHPLDFQKEFLQTEIQPPDQQLEGESNDDFRLRQDEAAALAAELINQQ